MAVAKPAPTQEMNRFFGEEARQDSSVRRLWSWFEHGRIQPGHAYAEFWVLVDEADDDTFRRVADVGMRLQERFPDADIIVYILSPEMAGPGEPHEGIRQEATELPLVAA